MYILQVAVLKSIAQGAGLISAYVAEHTAPQRVLCRAQECVLRRVQAQISHRVQGSGVGILQGLGVGNTPAQSCSCTTKLFYQPYLQSSSPIPSSRGLSPKHLPSTTKLFPHPHLLQQFFTNSATHPVLGAGRGWQEAALCHHATGVSPGETFCHFL